MYSEDSPLLGLPSIRVEQVLSYMLARRHDNYSDADIRTTIVPTYVAVCTAGAIDPLIAIAQMIHETGNLTAYWSARPRRNPAGIGVTGRMQANQPTSASGWSFNAHEQQWEMGVSFASWQDDAIPAHVGRPLAYALPHATGNDAQRALIQRAMAYRNLPERLHGTAPTLKPLGKVHNPAGDGWADPGTTYGAAIATIANQIMAY